MSYILTICLSLVSILSIESSCIDLNSKSRCYSNKLSDPFRFYGTKTTYTVAKAAIHSSLTMDVLPIPSDCQPIMLYFVGRHAIRYPDGEDIVEMSRVLSQLKQRIISSAENGTTQLCEQDLQSIRNWELKMVETDDNRISDTGIEETERIANDFKQRFPSLLDTNGVKIEVGITPKVRTEQTADAFIKGIQLNQNRESNTNSGQSSSAEDSGYDSSSSNEQSPQSDSKTPNVITKSQNPILYFHDTCKDLLLEQGVRLEKPKLVKNLRKSHLMQKLIEKVNERVGAGSSDGPVVDGNVLRQIVRACYFEFAIHQQRSGWCSLLHDEELKLLEYLDDIEDFHEDAYGRDINRKQTCPLIGDLYAKVKQSVKYPKEKKTFLHFTHAGVMKRLYSGLGLFYNLTNEFDQKTTEKICLSDDRLWKSSLVCPFSANFAAVLYKCPKTNGNNDNKSDNKKDKKYSNYKLLTLVQERPVLIGGCDSYFCSVDKFIKSYETMSKNCNLQEICRI